MVWITGLENSQYFFNIARMEEKNKNGLSVYLLWIIVLFQAASGVYGGIALIADPSGESLNMPLAFLQGTPFNNYFIPGLILFTLLGVVPAITFFGLVSRKSWRWAGALNIYRNRHWSWAFSLYISIMLIFWIDMQVMLIGYNHFIQTLYALVGLAIIVFALLPSVMRSYAWQ